MIYFTADFHLNHERIIKYCKRPFKNVDEMNNTILANCFTVLREGDIMYHIGDYGMGLIPVPNPARYRVMYLKGNHDRGEYWTGTPETITFKTHGLRFHLSHLIDEYVVADAYDIYLCGHVHEKWRYYRAGNALVINVGVDVWDFKPASLKEIISLYKQVKSGRLPSEG